MVAGLALAAGKMQFPKLWVLTASPTGDFEFILVGHFKSPLWSFIAWQMSLG
jgi:hypothetical protein